MNIINNLTGNHYQQIIDMAKKSDTLYIISPFLMESFAPLFYEFKNMDIKKIYLITKLKNNDMDLLKKANALHSFCTLCVKNGIQYEVYIDNKLHGKMYIASKKGTLTFGILSSANFTESGLNHNHEWGVRIEDPQILKVLIEEVFSVCSKPLGKDNLTAIIEKVDQFFKTQLEPEQPKLDLTISEFIDFDTGVTDIKYFLKPVGWSEEPYSENSRLNTNIENLYFSKRKPRAVQVGDIIICYAVGTTKLLGYFEVITSPVYSGDDRERWPWSVQAKNLCPLYSENWVNYDNTLAKVKDSFNLNETITYIGGKTLGGINYGSDKIRLNKRFAEHLIGIMESSTKITNPILDMSSLKDPVPEIARILASRCMTMETPLITYGELAKMLSHPINPKSLDQPLCSLSSFCKQNSMPLLSVIVINQEKLYPGRGFFKIFFPQAKKDDWDAIYLQQYKLVTEYNNWDRLANNKT